MSTPKQRKILAPRNREGKKECFSRVLAAGFDNSEGMAGTLCHAQTILEGVLSGMPPPPQLRRLLERVFCGERHYLYVH